MEAVSQDIATNSRIDSRTRDHGRQKSHSHINQPPRIHRKDRLSSRVLVLCLLNIQRALIRPPKPIVRHIIDPNKPRPASQLPHPERRPFARKVAAVPAIAASLLPRVHVRGADGEGQRGGPEGREAGLRGADAGKRREAGESVVHGEVGGEMGSYLSGGWGQTHLRLPDSLAGAQGSFITHSSVSRHYCSSRATFSTCYGAAVGPAQLNGALRLLTAGGVAVVSAQCALDVAIAWCCALV